MNCFGMTDVGMRRSENQDSYAFFSLPRKKMPPASVLLLCDGMGGQGNGELASRMAVSAFAETLMQLPNSSPKSALQEALDNANRAVYDKSAESPEYRGMGTTLVSAVADGERVTVLHVGDSRAYLYRKKDRKILALTHDHSLVQELMDDGKITEEEARDFSMKNVITKAVGVDPILSGTLNVYPWEEGDRLLLCSDGLWNYVEGDKLLPFLDGQIPLSSVPDALIKTANAMGGEDNVTVILMENTKENCIC
ncbi:MAG: Stp1/IreP family PP2C-type Ser/Thr phosphatase [Clostridia bacterium]|nr:Stp1/IreP family PP2C-type Ser/Thr phosphatase [Clostridia bacterium]